jgi:hypothetical protein
MINVRFATPEDYDAVSELRLTEYRKAKEFVIKDESMISKQRGMILIAENEEKQVLSTMQMEVYDSLKSLSEASIYYPPHDFSLFPTLYLNRAASSSQFRNKGLNSLLRRKAFEFAVENRELKSISGAVYEGAPRINLLKSLGYHFIETEEKIEYLAPTAKMYFIYLERAQFEAAKSTIENIINSPVISA